MGKVKKFNEYFNADVDYKVGVIDNVIEKNGNNDVDYVFENKDGSIINIQFDTYGKRHDMKYSTTDDFVKKNHPDLKDYRYFYDQVFNIPFNKQLNDFFDFVGLADGESSR